MVYSISLGKTREKGIHHSSGRRVYTKKASEPEKEKREGFHGGGVPFSTQTLSTEKKSGGINFGKYHSMITE